MTRSGLSPCVIELYYIEAGSIVDSQGEYRVKYRLPVTLVYTSYQVWYDTVELYIMRYRYIMGTGIHYIL